MRSRMKSACDFARFNPSSQQRICNQRAMTAPGNGFGAHDRNPLRFRKLYQIVQIFPELGRLHVIGVATETGITPSGIQ